MTALELSNKIDGMQITEALDEIENVLITQGDSPDEEILLMKAQGLFALAETQEYDRNRYEIIVDILTTWHKKFKFEPFYPYVLYMLTFSLLMLEDYNIAEQYAEQYYETHDNDEEASFFLAVCYCETESDLNAALSHINEYLKTGDYIRGISIKIDIFIYMRNYQEALVLINDCKKHYADQYELWDTKMIVYYNAKNEVEPALLLMSEKLKNTTSPEERYQWFSNANSLIIRNQEKAELIAYLRDYIKEYPNDVFAVSKLAESIEFDNLSESIALYEQVYGQQHNMWVLDKLTELYRKRGSTEDAEKYFQLINDVLIYDRSFSWDMIKMSVYGKFYKQNSGQSIRLLKSYLSRYPEHDCSYTMLGKIYEIGVGVPIDKHIAFEYFEHAYMHSEKQCSCSKLCYAYALYYGIGTDIDREKAKTIILDMEQGEDDNIRACLCAVFMKDGDGRFDKQYIIELLHKYKHRDIGSALFLYQQETDENVKERYWNDFLSVYNDIDQWEMERDYFKKYVDDPTITFVPFVSN